MSLVLETVTGNLVDPINPKKEDISIDDIAWGLSRMPRFAGHTLTQIPYNVGQHSIYVTQLVHMIITKSILAFNDSDTKEIDEYIKYNGVNKILLKALLHDAAEVYTGDIPSPIKKVPELYPIIKQIEQKLNSAIYSAFGLDVDKDIELKIIKKADKIAQKIEAHHFMPSRGKNWPDLPDVGILMYHNFPEPMPSVETYKQFLEEFQRII